MKIKLKEENSRLISKNRAAVIAQRATANISEYSARVEDNTKPFTNPISLTHGDVASPQYINEFFNDILVDTNSIELSLGEIQEELKEDYNKIITEAMQATEQLAELKRHLLAYSLYANTEVSRQNISFSSSTAINTVETTLSFDEELGGLTLPVSNIKNMPVRDLKIISGNGRLAAGPRGNVTSMIDAQVQTWTAYEREAPSLTTPLEMGLKCELSGDVINRILINFALLDSPYLPTVKLITLHTDKGRRLIEPANNSYGSDQIFLIQFDPVKTTSIEIDIVQESSFQTSRFMSKQVIGIRELEIYQVSFLGEGRFTTNRVPTAGVIQGLSLEQTLDDSQIVYNIEYEIDIEDGFVPISPETSTAESEVLFTDKTVSSFVLKGTMSRKEELLETNRDYTKIAAHSIQTVQTEDLSEAYSNSISVVSGLKERFGAKNKFLLGKTKATDSGQLFEINLDPTDLDPRLHIEGITYYPTTGEGEDTEEVFRISKTPNGFAVRLGGPLGGHVPEDDLDVYMSLERITKFMASETEDGISIEYELPSSLRSDETKLYTVNHSRLVSTAYGAPGVTSVELPVSHTNIIFTNLTSTDVVLSPIFHPVGDQVTYIDGVTEFVDHEDDKFSFDLDSNTIYLSSALPENNSDLIITYSHKTKIPLEYGADWQFDRPDTIMSTSPLTLPRIGTHKIENRLQQRRLRLIPETGVEGPISILKGSIKPIGANDDSGISETLKTEIEFIDGASEFRTASAGLGAYSVDYKNGYIYISSQLDAPVNDRGFLPGEIQFKYIAVELEYRLGRVLREESDYKLSGDRVSLLRYDIEPDLAVMYKGKPTNRVDKSIAEFYSPVLRGITIKGAAIDPRLGAVV